MALITIAGEGGFLGIDSFLSKPSHNTIFWLICQANDQKL